jgi:hypothetical protein
MFGLALKGAESTRDLGVIISNNLKPSQQCITAAKKANRVLGMVYRNINNKSPRVMRKLYMQLVGVYRGEQQR